MPPQMLGEVLAALELQAQPGWCAALSRPFSVAVPEDRRVLRLYAVGAGSCALALEGRPLLHFGSGDLVLLPHGSAHVLCDAPGAPPVALAELLAHGGPEAGGRPPSGGRGPVTRLVCAQLGLADGLRHPFVDALPPLLHVPADGVASQAWIEPVLRQIDREARRRPAGSREVARRLAEALILQALREPVDAPGVAALAAIADPQLGRALAAMHAEPGADWSLARLARLAGLSRTLFAQRFRERMGLSPMRYLAAWRILKARSLLSEGRRPVGEVARRVGYGSESAFHRAFRERFGVPPGAFRRAGDEG